LPGKHREGKTGGERRRKEKEGTYVGRRGKKPQP